MDDLTLEGRVLKLEAELEVQSLLLSWTIQLLQENDVDCTSLLERIVKYAKDHGEEINERGFNLHEMRSV